MTYPTPKELYRASDLLKGYEPNRPMGFAHSWDFRIYRRYITDGATSPRTLAIRRGQAEHDAYISDALKRFLDHRTPKLVGIMGGHGLTRADAAYVDVVGLARTLTTQGYLIVSGGGPGAMEAAHLGALFAGADDSALQKALNLLRQAAQHWMNAALEARELAPREPAESLGVPTWRYGHEPTVPLASHYAKFFQNSLREEALITNSRAGIVYARGSGGTVREIFEDAERNYYAGNAAAFTPMIFFDRDRYWQEDAVFDANGKMVGGGLRVDDMVTKLFRLAPDFDAAACLRKIRFTTDIQEIADVLAAHSAVALRNLAFTVQGEPLKVSTAVTTRRAGD